MLSNALPVLRDSVDCVEGLNEKFIFTSFDIGLLKPDEKIYYAILDKLNVKANEVMFVDDKIENIKSAKNTGINTIIFNKETIEKDVKDIINIAVF